MVLDLVIIVLQLGYTIVDQNLDAIDMFSDLAIIVDQNLVIIFF